MSCYWGLNPNSQTNSRSPFWSGSSLSRPWTIKIGGWIGELANLINFGQSKWFERLFFPSMLKHHFDAFCIKTTLFCPFTHPLPSTLTFTHCLHFQLLLSTPLLPPPTPTQSVTADWRWSHPNDDAIPITTTSCFYVTIFTSSSTLKRCCWLIIRQFWRCHHLDNDVIPTL